MVEQSRRGAYARYAINSMNDIELHDATHVKTIVDNGGRCNATQSDVTRMASLSQSIVIMYLISIMMHTTWTQIRLTFTIPVCSWYTELRLMQRSSIGNAII